MVFPTQRNASVDYLIGGAPKAFASAGGPMVLDGMDPVCHASYGESTDRYIAKVVKSIYDQSSMPGNNGKIAILGVSSTSSAGGCGGNWNTLLSTKFLTGFGTPSSGLQPTVQFITTSAELDTFFGSTITSSPPKMLWIPDDWSRNSTISSKFTTNAEKIADFVNSGGGIFSSYNPYGWLTALLPSAVFNNGGCNGGPNATTDGSADFNLTNTDVAACWHGYFTGNVGTLKTLAEWRYPSASTSPLVAVSIGGGSVSLPSSFTLGVSPSSPRAGEDIVITALAQTISGTPQPGVVVTITVSSGPDAGQVFTATTDSSGIATITVRTSSTGTAVYTATAVVSGVSKTVSATVVWAPPTTTTAPSTTTTVAPSTTTTVASTTTVFIPPVTTTTSTTSTTVQETTTSSIQIAPSFNPTIVTNPAPTTTVHEHNHEEIAPIPQTGVNARSGWAAGIIMIFAGLIILFTNKKKRK